MKKEIRLLVIGKNSFIASNIYSILKNKIYIKKITYKDFLLLKNKDLIKFNFIVNCSLHPKYVKNKYNKNFDLDFKILNKIKMLKINFIFFSTRKIYYPRFNISEKQRLCPQDNYASNKLVTELLIKKILPDNYLILRISNIIGPRIIPNKKKAHKLFIDNFLDYKKNKDIPKYDGCYKDFITILQFTEIFFKMLKKNLKGIYNVSIGKKIFINDIVDWLTYYSDNSFRSQNINKKKIFFKSDSFTLNNNKIKKMLNISISKKNLKNYCLDLSRKIFLI
jgi:nucleoside-diphosphate-sugar epimerase